MTKKKNSNVSKNSKPVTTPKQKNGEEAKVKFTNETTVILTVSENGAFKCRSSNAGTKQQKEKMKDSWNYLKIGKKDKFTTSTGKELRPGEYQSKDGENWYPLKPGKMPLNYYEGPKTYNKPTYHECLRQIKLNAEAVQYYISDDSCPGRSKKERAEWLALSKYERLCRNCEITADPGYVISIKVIN